jgi:hypothetical protein
MILLGSFKAILSDTKKIICLCVIVILFTMSACGENQSLKIGFAYDNQPPDIMCAVKNDKNVFDMDDITLDFYYGPSHEIAKYGDENYERIAFAVYFCNAKYRRGFENINTTFTDFYNIKGHYFKKQISVEDFNSNNYAVSVKLFSGKNFNYHEEFTVPKEVIELSKGYFCIVIMEIYYSHKDAAYCSGSSGNLIIQYEVIDKQNVRLIKPSGTSYADPK